ncbi:P-loop containing nucleoside triphosphate hydrolase protein [Aspergillus caelatus]|uniref:P-loop containing nucleoside triphosphate hydrolase protein n=1 Tax=Aspergillus caelatus TaxID=61420 RepID=A0A5N6ZKY6_9EURO|nr:P-loop containing nucleoside triphosphate hydrolase protein [Aspergillus caelatus]KAE8357873.1 P-loop containing nucleoside triphosphate hydrolase protein [Aspergillus caelatus]
MSSESKSCESSDSDNNVIISYEPETNTTASTGKAKTPKGREGLKTAFGLVGNDEWTQWLKSDMVQPHWASLWNDFLRNRKGGERGPGLVIVQARVISGEAAGNRKYSAFTKDKTEWDEVDHYACFLYWVKYENTTSRSGVFFRTQKTEDEIDRLIWALKDWLRHIHAPSQIGKRGGGTAIFGSVRGYQKRTRATTNDDQSGATSSTTKEDTEMELDTTAVPETDTQADNKMSQEDNENDPQLSRWEMALQEECLSKKQQMILWRKSDTFDRTDPFWQYAMATTALKNCERVIGEEEPEIIADLETIEEEVDVAASSVMKGEPKTPKKLSKRELKAKYRAFDPMTTDIFNPEHYNVQEEIEYAHIAEISTASTVMRPTEEGLRQMEKQRQWFDNKEYQRENHEEACQRLNIPASSHPRLPNMHAGAMLKYWQPVAINALAEMKASGHVKGAILGDSVGLGKTWEAVGFLMHQYALFKKRYDAAKKEKKTLPLGKPTLIVVPPTLVGQWIGEIIAMTPLFKLWVYYGDYRATAGHNARVIDGKLTNDDEIFDGQPQRARVLILTTYQTLTARHGPSTAKLWCEKEKITYNPSQPPRQWKGSLAGLFEIAVFDEAHTLRNRDAQLSITAKWIYAEFNLLLTGTLFFNSVYDFSGYAGLVLKNDHVEPQQLTAHLFDLPKGHEKESLLLTHTALTKLIFADGIDLQLAGTRLRKILAQLMIRRTLSSSIPFESGVTIGQDIPGYKRKMVMSELNEAEELAYKALEVRYRQYILMQDKHDKTKYRWNMDRLRKLTLFSSWIGFQWLEKSLVTQNIAAALHCLKEGTLIGRWMRAIEDCKVLDNESSVIGFYRTAYKVAQEIERPTFALEFLLRGSPKMRSMIPIIRDQVFLHHEKSIVWTMWPAEQVYVAACLKEIGIDVAVLHSGLDTTERTRLIDEFTMQEDKCMVLISTFSISSAGLNLQKLCRNAHLFSPPTSQSIANQAIGRVCRLGQTKIVLIYEYLAEKTFQCWLRRRGVNKALPGIITELSLNINDQEVMSDHKPLTRWRIRNDKLTYLEDGEEPQEGDIFDASMILEQIIESMQGTD